MNFHHISTIGMAMNGVEVNEVMTVSNLRFLTQIRLRYIEEAPRVTPLKSTASLAISDQ